MQRLIAIDTTMSAQMLANAMMLVKNGDHLITFYKEIEDYGIMRTDKRPALSDENEMKNPSLAPALDFVAEKYPDGCELIIVVDDYRHPWSDGGLRRMGGIDFRFRTVTNEVLVRLKLA